MPRSESTNVPESTREWVPVNDLQAVANMPSSDSTREAYASLTLFVEVLGAKPFPGSADLVTALLDTLSNTIHDTSTSPSDRSYVEQLLLSALENAVSNIPVCSSCPCSSSFF